MRPMGFTYDCYVTADPLERVSEEERAQILCRAILLDGDQSSAFGSLLEPLPDEELTERGEDAYAADCAARRAAGGGSVRRYDQRDIRAAVVADTVCIGIPMVAILIVRITAGRTGLCSAMLRFVVF